MQFIVRGTKYEFDQGKLTFKEARDVQKVTGRMFGQIAADADQGDFEALQAMVWIAIRRTDSAFRFSELDSLELGEFEAVPDPDEEVDRADPPAPGDEEETSTRTG